MHPSLSDQSAYYDKRWRETQFANAFGMERGLFILEGVLDEALDQPRCLDLGCGTGWLTGVLSAFGPAVGVELSSAAVDLARQRYPHALFFAGDVLAWQWDGDPFDIVVSQEVIEHVPDQSGYVAKLAQYLRPGGLLLLTTPNARTLAALPEAERREWLRQPVELIVDRGQLRRLLAPHFEIDSYTTCVTGIGQTGLDRIVNSYKVGLVMRALGLERAWRAWRKWAGFGMYQALAARKR